MEGVTCKLQLTPTAITALQAVSLQHVLSILGLRPDNLIFAYHLNLPDRMLNRFRSRKMPSSPSLLQRFHTMFKRRGKPTTHIQSNEWNIPLPPDLMYHIIDTYLATSTVIALCVAFPVLRPYCHPQPYRHITVYICKGWSRSQNLLIKIGLSKCPPTLEQEDSILLSTLDDLGYAGTEKARGILSLVSDLTHDITSIHLHTIEKWNKLDEYVKVYIIALLQRSGLCSVKLTYCDIPVNH